MSSSNKLDQIDRSILAALQGDLDGTLEPYAAIADRIGVSEQQVLKRVHRLVEAGVIRRIGGDDSTYRGGNPFQRYGGMEGRT